MVIDSSALIAILLNESERQHYLDLILAAERKLLSAATAVEAGIVLEYCSSQIAIREFDLFLHLAGIEIVSVDANPSFDVPIRLNRFESFDGHGDLLLDSLRLVG